MQRGKNHYKNLIKSLKSFGKSEDFIESFLISFDNFISKFDPKKSVNKKELESFLNDFSLTEEEKEAIKDFLIFKNYNLLNEEDYLNLLDYENNKRYERMLGMYTKSNSSFQYTKNLSYEEQLELIKKAQKGDKNAEEEVIYNNMGLVISVAKEYAHFGIDIGDLISEGFFGLINALKNFDINKDVKFSTYATVAIKNSIRRTISENKRIIRLPLNVVTLQRKVINAKDELVIELKREPSVEEIYEKLNHEVNIDKIQDILSLPNSTVSFDDVLNEDSTIKYEDAIKNQDEEGPVDYLNKNESHDAMEKALMKLSARERDILMLRSGFKKDKQYTLEEIGKKYGLTRERVRQIEFDAKHKIKEYLKGDYDDLT